MLNSKLFTASSYRNKAYDNLQNILNSESYLDTMTLPYNSGRYYNADLDTDRNKRAYKIFNQLANKFPDMRLVQFINRNYCFSFSYNLRVELNIKR